MAGEQVLEGRQHRYVLGQDMGRGLFRGVDDEGRQVAIRIGARELLLAQAALTRLLPAGVLPRLVEFADLGKNNMGFLVTELVTGFTLKDLLLEGRRLSPEEGARLADDVARALMAVNENGITLEALLPEEIVFETAGGGWRLLTPGRWVRGRAEASMAQSLSLLILDVSDAGRDNGRFARVLRQAARGEERLAHIARTATAAARQGGVRRRLATFFGMF